MNLATAFTHFAKTTARLAGKPATFAVAAGTVLVWAVLGPVFGYSDTWQLTINTGTTIITFLMVFLIQNTQNRDAEAMHLKVAELIRAVEGAHNAMLDIEELSEAELDHFRLRYEKLARAARARIKAGGADTGREELEAEVAIETAAKAEVAAAKQARFHRHREK